MSLYDDIDESPKTKAAPAGWSSGIKLLQSQLQLKKAMVTQPKREAIRKATPLSIAGSENDQPAKTSTTVKEPVRVFINQNQTLPPVILKADRSSLITELDWDIDLEYDPMHPSDYDKIARERRERRGFELEVEETEKKRRAREERDSGKDGRPRMTTGTGFAGRATSSDEEEDAIPKRPAAAGGAAIAPPPSLQESTPSGGAGGLGVAAKIMAKYGFKEGQGLGRQQQGISTALQVEKTSKRGGRIINEKEIMPPPPPSLLPGAPAAAPPVPKPELTIAEMMKNPSKVILLRNMVGPGEVDSDLEPEVREECHTKYGDVHKVVILEVAGVEEEESVRIFVEFKRIEAAIKGVIDLNGRFFAGRHVRAGFYDQEKFTNGELDD